MVENITFLQLFKILYIAWLCLRNDVNDQILTGTFAYAYQGQIITKDVSFFSGDLAQQTYFYLYVLSLRL